MANTNQGFVFVFCKYIGDPTNLKLVRYFWFYSALETHWFHSAVTRVTRLANEIYLQYLKFSENVSIQTQRILGVRVAQSQGKVRIKKKTICGVKAAWF